MSNNNIRTVLVVGKTVGERVRADEVGKTVSMRCSDGKTVRYEADEVVCGDNVSVETSVQLRTIVRQVELGHNSALIVADSTAQQTISEGVTSSVMRSVMAVLRKNEREKGTKYEVFATAAEVPTATTARDLSSEGSAARPIRCGSNPMFGVCLMDMQERTLRSEDDAGLFVRETLRKSSKASVLDIVHVTVKQVGRGADVYVSALVFLLVKGQGEYLRRLVAMDEGVVPTVLTKGVLGGNSCVAAVVGFSGNDVAVDTSILGSTAKLREIRNAPPRSGNLSRFVEFVTGQLSDCKAALERSKDGPERDRHERMLRKLEVMLADGKKLLSDPEGTRPRVYAPNKGPVVDGGAVKVGAAEKSESVKKGGPTNGTASAASPPKPKAEEAAPGAAGPWETPLKLVVTEGPKPPDNTIEIEVDGEKKVHRVDECIQRSGSRPVSSLVVQRMKEVLEKGCNVSLLSAEMVPGLAVDKHVTWNFAQEILRDTLNKKKDGVTRELALYMSVLKGKQVVIDLFGGSEKLQLTIAKSPLFGVVVHGTSAKFVKDPTEVAPVFETALKRAKELLMGEEYIVCTAVLKQITGTDVIVSSLFVVSASDMQPYIDAIEKKPTHSQTLFAHPFLGPCSTAMLVSYQAMNDRVVKALNAHRKMALENSKAPGGSVRQFVGVMERSVASAEESLKKLGDSKERVHQERSLQDKKQALQDAKRLLENPNEAQPAAYAVPQAQECGGIDPTVRVVVILTEKRDGKKRCIMDKGSGFAVRTPAEEADFPADEVVKRLGQAATIRSSSVDFLIDHFVRGYNVALLTADGEGFSTGLPLLEHSARSVLGKIAPSSELFVMLASIKTDRASAKDLLHEGATYEPLQHASSPLFGPCVADAKLERIKTSDSLLRSLNDAVKVCEADKTMFFSLFVHKERRASDGDVVLSSFLILLAGDNIDVYKSALEKRQKERGLLQYALGGPCLTAFTLGLTTATTDIDKPLAFGKLAKDAHGSRNGTIRTGGVRRFVAFSTKALEQLRALQKKAPESDRKRLMENATNVERVLADSEELLRNPCDRVPRAYKHEV
ncbi:unnamed protein product [Trypanosoma congolense IL3000]|uniref:WGS project CAEQ00000000 data, annotated contig 491 n=1 Tax=Trypanosoma congolense (strain IL3000) TaxID=1068625 RepID=F9WGD3_TRYCI|nr:unnamed protein product [Trypanosoma congolense IL3000]